MKTLPRDQPYISLWHILKEFPQLKDDFKISEIWPGLRWDWGYTFLGPGKSVTGFHYDYPNNLFCQVSGAKEFLLVPPDQNPYMAPSSKYDWGGKMSHIDITRLDEQPERAAMFAQASGLYARVESGDALFVPRRTWHAVVSSIPSVSLAVFGLTPRELVVDGVPSGVRAALHAVGLYGRGNCTCHGKARAPMESLLRSTLAGLVSRGSLEVHTASGARFAVGDGTGTPVAIRFTDANAQWAFLLDPELRF
eukprot:gene5624-7182_t